MTARKNYTLITEFMLLGFGDLHSFKNLLFIVFLIVYVMTVSNNVLVIILVIVNQSLRSPMYFFLSHLSFSEILFTSNIVPNLLWLILVGGGKVSIGRCFFQSYLLAVPVVTQCLLLGSMSFDRYLAICKPLHYGIIMTIGRQTEIATSCWLLGFTVSLVLYVLLNSLEFCGPDTINHFYCDLSPVVELSCSENSSVELYASTLTFPLVISPFVFISTTYMSILGTIFKMPSTMGRQKAFSTCSSHLTVVGLYFGSLGSKYIVPSTKSSVDINKGLSLLYAVVTPLVNPLIYSLRNQEMRSAIRKLFHF